STRASLAQMKLVACPSGSPTAGPPATGTSWSPAPSDTREPKLSTRCRSTGWSSLRSWPRTAPPGNSAVCRLAEKLPGPVARLAGDGYLTGRRRHGGRQGGAEERHLDRAVDAGRALVDVAERRRADALPRHRERDPVALDPDHLDGASIRVADLRAVRRRYLR